MHDAARNQIPSPPDARHDRLAVRGLVMAVRRVPEDTKSNWYQRLDLYIAGELHGVLFPAEIISGWIAQDSELGELA
jgi:hypothetical protein